MAINLANITIDCTDVAKVAQFWSAALERPMDDGGTELMTSIARDDPGTPTWLFIKVPEGKAAKNRMHVDFGTDDREAEVTRLTHLGATRKEEHHEYGIRWTVLADPEGNEFCVGRPEE